MTPARRSVLAFCALAACAPAIVRPTEKQFHVIRIFDAIEARQGVAVDAHSFYAIDNRSIGKYDKLSGRRIAHWDAADDRRFIHLNSGVVVDGKLYCAHSNYPATPMRSSIEIFDTENLSHRETLRLPEGLGSATWVDRFGADWWVVFANYTGRGGEPGKGTEATLLVRLDANWNIVAQYRFPDAILDRFGTRSNSGGSWGADGLLYLTGHDGRDIFVVRVPREGDVLELTAILAAEIDGQGIAWDRSEPGTLYGIVKRERKIVVVK